MVAVIYLGHFKLCPFAAKYVDTLRENKIPYEIIQWDREGHSDETEADHIHTFRLPRKRYANPLTKLRSVFAFRRFVLRIIREKRYDKLVVLTTVTGMLLYPLLTHSYRNRFIFDYRDASYENLPLFGHFLKRLAQASAFTAISSKGFLSLLPSGQEYVMAHNFKYSDLAHRAHTCPKQNAGQPIHLSYIGVLREVPYLKQMMDAFGGDDRFRVSIHGGGDFADELCAYAARYPNVECTGAFAPEEKAALITQSDMLIYNYPCSFINNHALANKFYDGIIFKRPFYVNRDTYSGSLVCENGLGIGLSDGMADIADRIYEYYQSFDPVAFVQHADRMLDEALAEDAVYMEKIHTFFTQAR